MQRNPAQSSHLRRRYQAFQDQKHNNGFRPSSNDASLDGQNGLELSMHLPTEPNRNRFELLGSARPFPSFASEDRWTHAQPRRYRHSRGTREAKRRRDARRKRRKLLEAQALDEQLSRDIGRTLDSANVRRPPQLRLPTPKPVSPRPSVQPPQPIHGPPTPLQLPYLNFGGLDLLRDFPRLARVIPTPPPLSPPLYTPQIPGWYPDLPSLASKKSKDDIPLFFDLSSLPEPFQTPRSTPPCQDVQLWQPKLCPQPTKQSRFFPPRPTSPKPSVEPPPTACTLHKSDKGMQTKPTSPTHDDHTEASAANLWRILTSNDFRHRDASPDPYVASFTTRPSRDAISAPHATYDTRMQAIDMPAELDDTEVLPYAHPNGLTGYCGNARAEFRRPSRDVEEFGTVLYDSPLAMTPVGEMFAGMNEMVVDHDVLGGGGGEGFDGPDAFSAWPPLPASPEAPGSEAAAVPCGSTYIPTVDGKDVPIDPLPLRNPVVDTPAPAIPATAHAQSEHDISLSSSPPDPLLGPRGREGREDFIDVASFLEMGPVVPDCWCRPGRDTSDNGDNKIHVRIPTPLPGWNEEGEEEGWMLCSSARTGAGSPSARSTSACEAGGWESVWESEWEWEEETLVDEEDDEEQGSDVGGDPAEGAEGAKGGVPAGRWACTSPSSLAHGAW